MFRSIRKLTFYAASISITSFCAVTLLSVMNPGHAAANYNTDANCTDYSTEFNVVVAARVFDYQGNLKGYANDFTFHVHAYETYLNYRDRRANGTWGPWVRFTSDDPYPSGHDQYSNETIAWNTYKSEAIRRWDQGYYTRTGVNADFGVQMNGNYTGVGGSASGMAPGQGNACQLGTTMAPAYAFRDGDNTQHVTLQTANGYGSTAAWTNQRWVGLQALGHGGNNMSWSLSCLGQNDPTSGIPINNMWFRFGLTNASTWDRTYIPNNGSYSTRQLAQPGGTWSNPPDQWAANRTSLTVYFDYHEPTPPIVSPSVDLLGSMEEGTNVTAQGFINNGTNTSGSVTYTRQWWYESTGNDSLDSGEQLLGPGNASGSAGFGPTGRYSIGDWGPVALDGIHTRVCTRLYITGVSNYGIVSPGSSPAILCRNIIRKPYVQVFNGDVDATAVFPNLTTGIACPSVGALSGSILAFNNGVSAGYTGSGSNLAAYAMGTIDQFVTGNTHAANLPRYLSFANAAGGTGYGGGFGRTHCLSSALVDDFNKAKADVSGPVTVTQPATTTYEKYVNGDVYITSNMTYPASFSIDTIPRFKVVATGNIYILSSVGNLDGVYEAAGKIYTCSVWSGSNLTVNGSMDAACKAQSLTVNGALIANEVKLLRSKGTVGLMNGAAETLNFSPEVWLKEIRNNTGSITTSTTTEYDAITNMPPVL